MREPVITTEWIVPTNDKNDRNTCFYSFQNFRITESYEFIC